MSQHHVRPGRIAKDGRRQSAILRIEKHLKERQFHNDLVGESEAAISHDKAQRAELERLKKMSTGS